MMDAQYLRSKHEQGLSYADYLAAGTQNQQDHWRQIGEQVELTDTQRQLLAGFSREMKVIVLSGRWCGDCVQQGPLLERIARGSDHIDLRWLERSDHMDLQEKVSINAGHRVPVVIFCAEDYELVGWYGDRTLCRYRALARKQLGGACPLPAASVPQHELEESLQCWLNEFERANLLLRLSTRLRKKHDD